MSNTIEIPEVPTAGYRPTPEAFASRFFLLANIAAGAGVPLARRLAALGARTVLLDPSREVLEKTDDEIRAEGGTPPVLQALDPLGATVADYDALARAVARERPALDGLVWDCGYVGHHGPILTHPPEHWYAILRAHLDAAFAITQAFLPALSALPQATVIYTTSEEGRRPRAFAGAHAVAHAGLETLARIGAEEYAYRGSPRFYTLDPGEVATTLREAFFPGREPGEVPPASSIVDAYLELLDPTRPGPGAVACLAHPDPESAREARGTSSRKEKRVKPDR